MSDHQQFADDLALYALDALEPSERLALEEHLRDCAACRRELQQLRGDAALLALAVPSHEPPAHARRRLMSAIAAEPRGEAQAARRLPLWGILVPTLAAAVFAVVAFMQSRQNEARFRELRTLQREFAQQRAQLQQTLDVVATLNDPAAARFTLTAANRSPQPQAKAIYQRSRHSLIFLASNLPALPPQKAYELWLIPTSGAPIPAGVFKPDAKGSATILNPPLPEGVEAKTFAVTVEPEGGSAAPTSQPIMTGVGG